MTISSTKTKSLATWGNHIQRVKIVTNDNIIEQVTDLNTWGTVHQNTKLIQKTNCKHNKIKGAIWTHFGKQMNKETKLRIHNITAKAALKFGSEAWVLRKERNNVQKQHR